MYVCLNCNKKFKNKEQITKHFLKCWKDVHPNHTSKEAPRSKDIISKQVNNDIIDFFNSFTCKEENNGRNLN